MKMIITDKITRFTATQISRLEKYGDLMFTPTDKNALDNLEKNIYQEEVILAPDPEIFNWEISLKTLKKFDKLKAICLSTTSYQFLNTEYCEKNGIKITNVPNYSTQAVADYALFMMMALVRKFPLIFNSSYKGGLEFIQEELTGKTMGILGLGNIGSRIAKIGKDLGMKIIYWSKNKKIVPYKSYSVKKVLKKSDFIFPCYELLNDTYPIFNNQDNLESINPDAYLIIPTIGSSKKLGEKAFDFVTLREMLRNKQLAGLAYEDPVFYKKGTLNIFTPPPIAWYTKESLERCYKELVDKIIKVTKD